MTARAYVDHGGRIERKDGQVEAVRYYKTDGANFSGWIVRSNRDIYSYSDPIPTKAEAIKAMLTWDICICRKDDEFGSVSEPSRFCAEHAWMCE